MKLFNYIIQHKYDYLNNLIVDGDYIMTEEDEKDYKDIKGIATDFSNWHLAGQERTENIKSKYYNWKRR